MNDVYNGKTYYPLGKRTLFALVARKSWLFILLLASLLLFRAWYAVLFYFHLSFFVWATLLYMQLLFLVGVGTLLAGCLEYLHYGIFFNHHTIAFTHGILRQKTTSLGYSKISDVIVCRNLMSKILGVSDIAIIMADNAGTLTSEVSLPAVEKNLALDIQKEILANVVGKTATNWG